jgi:[ribosomal protein S5]-alanine N-acetyltransferase
VTHQIDGERIRLREVRLTDVTERYVQWMNDPEVNQYLETRFEAHSAADIAAYVKAMTQAANVVFLAIIRKADALHLGNLRIGEIDRRHATASIALVLGEKSVWGQGFGCEAIALAARYAFDVLGLRKLNARCYANNLGSLAAFRKAGWREEGVQREQFTSGAHRVDGIWLGLVREP